jgi:predicted ArsR family transcriptional regulator
MPDPRAHRVLASVSRVAVLEVLRRAGRPLGVQDLADTMGLHANTVRKHLDLLLEFGHVTRLRDESGRPGRPRQVYALATPPQAVGPEQRNYRLLASILTSYLRGGDDPQAAALEAGRRFGAELVEPPPGGPSTAGDTKPDTPATLDRVIRMLDAIGFQPQLTADRSAIRLHHCPFHELAEDQPDIVCRIHLGLIQGALQQLGAPAEAMRLIPFVTPRLCVVEVGPPPPQPAGSRA